VLTATEALTESEEETAEIARGLGERFTGGEVVLLFGELGAGKTAFVKGLAHGLGCDGREVVSPTFVLLTSHPGRLRLDHVDLYRLGAGVAEAELGLQELPGPEGVLAVEWAERLGEPLPWRDYWRVELRHDDAGGDRRRIRVLEVAG